MVTLPANRSHHHILEELAMSDKADVLQRVLAAIADGEPERARDTASTEYPFSSRQSTGRMCSDDQAVAIFMRDGFIDRYSGTRLVYPGALRLLSRLLPDELPFHSNWKMSTCHVMYWELYPTIDHVVPVARGGEDDESNWVTTSMLRNSAKSNWTLSELGWDILPPGDLDDWDGLMNAFVASVRDDLASLADPFIRRWYKTAERAVRP